MQVKLAANDWIFILQLIYRLNRIDDFSTLCLTFLQQIKVLIPHTESRVYRVRREAGRHHPYARICCSCCGTGTINEDFDVTKYDCFWSEYLYAPWSNVFRHSDLDCVGDFQESELYRNVYVPQNIHHAMKMVLIQDDRLLGVCALFRPKTDQDFSRRDVYILNLIKEHLALRFSQLLGEPGFQVTNNIVTTNIHKISAQYSLTKREHEVLTLMFKDVDDQDICQQLFISPSTLKKHISNIYQKTNVRNRIQLYNLTMLRDD
ncbi:MAG: helix-turn-helix transcriptional regulator [Clostridiales bacterium]|jgi:DNA-binding NarL/FixJ family response regulator|nr:helix-turn-helix transcriptional regulator [Clostridiales bacterium]